MIEDNFEEEKSYDEYFTSIEKDEIPVPKELEERLMNRISSLKKKRDYAPKVVALIVAFLLLFVGGIKYNPRFAAYAASIPGFKGAVEWLLGDSGIQNAKNHGYKEMEGIRVNENGFELTLSDMIMDEDRIHFSTVVSGEKIKKLLKDNQNDLKKPHGFAGANNDKYYPISLFVSFSGLSYSVSGSPLKGAGDDVLAREMEHTFESAEFDKFLGSEPKYLKMEVKIYKGQTDLYTFKPINIPFDKLNFTASKNIRQNKKIVLDHTEILLNNLKISPTRMKLNLQYKMEEGYTFTGFENPRLEDSEGNVYKAEGLVGSSNSNKDYNLYFVPSLFFESLPENLTFCFDGIRIASEKGKTITLRLDEKYPKIWRYMGQDITIRNASWREKGKQFVVSYVAPKSGVLKLQDLRLFGISIDTASWGTSEEMDINGNIVKVIVTSFPNVDKRDAYKVGLQSPGYLIPGNTSCELNTK